MTDPPDIFGEMATRYEQVFAEARQRWVSTLAIGNGGALFAVFSIALKDGQLLMAGPVVAAAWIFFVGIIAASLAHAATAAAFRHHEVYWRSSSAQRSWLIAKEEAKAKAIQEDIDKADQAGNDAELAAGWLSATAAVCFAVGLAIPLAALTFRLFS